MSLTEASIRNSCLRKGERDAQNQIIRGRHRGFALLTGRWRTLRHITTSPSKIGGIARATLVLALSSTATSHENR
jgi:hypothetical protein